MPKPHPFIIWRTNAQQRDSFDFGDLRLLNISRLHIDHFEDPPTMDPFARAHGAKDSRVRTSMLCRAGASVGACGFTKEA